MSRLDRRTARDIDAHVNKLIKDLDLDEPPINLETAMDLLSVSCKYYNLDDPSLIDDFRHKLRIGVKRVKDIIGKISLKGIWVPDDNLIMVDQAVPDIKKRWVTAHEISHRLQPAHNIFLLGDTSETIDPDYREMIEAEANYGASTLLFLSKKFTEEAIDKKPSIKSIKQLSKRYSNSITMTFRRYIEYSHDIPLAGIICKPLWRPEKLKGNSRCRYFIKSKEFRSKFSSIDGSYLMKLIDNNISISSGGPLGVFTCELIDVNGNRNEFKVESFYNKYDILSLVSYIRII